MYILCTFVFPTIVNSHYGCCCSSYSYLSIKNFAHHVPPCSVSIMSQFNSVQSNSIHHLASQDFPKCSYSSDSLSKNLIHHPILMCVCVFPPHCGRLSSQTLFFTCVSLVIYSSCVCVCAVSFFSVFIVVPLEQQSILMFLHVSQHEALVYV